MKVTINSVAARTRKQGVLATFSSQKLPAKFSKYIKQSKLQKLQEWRIAANETLFRSAA